MKFNHAKPVNIFLQSVKESQRKQETKCTDKYMQHQAPGPTDYEIIAWWRQVLRQLDKQHQNGLNSLVVLVIWWIWNHRKLGIYVFGGSGRGLLILAL